jgi:hypothetical protein
MLATLATPLRRLIRSAAIAWILDSDQLNKKTDDTTTTIWAELHSHAHQLLEQALSGIGFFPFYLLNSLALLLWKLALTRRFFGNM